MFIRFKHVFQKLGESLAIVFVVLPQVCKERCESADVRTSHKASGLRVGWLTNVPTNAEEDKAFTL
jgi:hypothetical protein